VSCNARVALASVVRAAPAAGDRHLGVGVDIMTTAMLSRSAVAALVSSRVSRGDRGASGARTTIPPPPRRGRGLGARRLPATPRAVGGVASPEEGKQKAAPADATSKAKALKPKSAVVAAALAAVAAEAPVVDAPEDAAIAVVDAPSSSSSSSSSSNSRGVASLRASVNSPSRRARASSPNPLLSADIARRDVTTKALPRLTRLEKNGRFPVLFSAPEMKALAEKIGEEDIEGGTAVELGSIDWRTFPDGFPNLFVNDAHGVRDRHVAFLASFHSPEVIFEQISVIYSLPKMFVASFTLILPFFPTGTSERVEREGEIATAVTLARILSKIPLSRGGPCSTLIFDIHALQERFYFGDNILPYFESGIPLLLNRIAELDDADNIVIAYPDEGARKRFGVFFKSYEEVVCTKVRDGEKRLVKLKEGEPAGRHVISVDDLVQSGGTLIECQKLLSRLGAMKVSAYVTHGVFPNASWKRFTASSGAGGQGFYKFWLTDSCPGTAENVSGVAPFEILSLARPIAEALQV